MSVRKGLLAPAFISLLILFGGCSQESLIFHPEVLPADYQFKFPIPFEEVTLQVDGAVIHALLFKSAKARGVVLYFHGNAGSLRTWGEIAPEFTSRGYDLFIPDYRGFGKSTGRADSEATLLRDGAAAYAYVAGLYSNKRILVYGRSIGTGIAAFVAQKASPKALILESPFFSFTDLAAYHYPLLPRSILETFLRYSFHTDAWMKNIACPVYLFHGTKDDIIPSTASQRLMDILGDKGTLILVDGGGHNDLADFGVYREKLDAILAGKGRS